jgi:hypothetical protein
MYTLQRLLVSLKDQKLGAGYLTPTKPTAYECAVDLRNRNDPIFLLSNPITPPDLLRTPAWVSSLRGQDAIYLADVDGNLNKANGPAYVFSGAGGGGGGAGNPFQAGNTSQGASSGVFGGITAVQINLAQAGTLQSVSAFNQAGITNILLGVYSDSANFPTTLLASSAIAPSVVGLNTLPMTTNPRLNPGKYWLAIEVQTNGVFTGYWNAGGLGAFFSSQAWGGSLPNPFPTVGSGAATGAFNYSLYMTLAP